ncbi:MAG: helix-turn-helix transcriptional regulator [Streptosporangiaceae bacterium]
MAEGSPTVRRRELGALLRRLREEQGMSVKQVTEHLMCSPSKVSRIETGQRGATLRDVRDLCNFYSVTDEVERERLMRLAREGKEQGWWQPYDLPYSTYVGLEAEARLIRDYQSSVVPGLLQTADYARAGHEGAMPRLSSDVIDQRVQARLARQALLTQNAPPKFQAVLDEAVLHRAVGGPRVMSAQLRKILELSALPNVTVQVIPYAVGAHPAVESNFNLLQLAPPAPGVIFVEGLVGSIYLEREEDLARYDRIFTRLQEISLNPKDTADLIAEIRERYETGLIAHQAG